MTPDEKSKLDVLDHNVVCPRCNYSATKYATERGPICLCTKCNNVWTPEPSFDVLNREREGGRDGE